MPGPYFGKDAFFAWITETTNGTPVAPTSAQYNGFKSCSVAMKAARTAGNRNLGRNYERDVRLHQKRAEGDITMDMAYQGYDHLERHLFGAGSCTSVNGSGGDAGAYTHTFLGTGVDEVGGTLTLNAGGQKMVYPGCKVVKGTYNFKKNDPLELVLSIVGQAMASNPGAAVSPSGLTFLDAVGSGTTIPTVNPVEPSASSGQAFRLYIGSSPATQGGALADYADAGMYDGSLSIDIPHDTDRAPIGKPTISNPLINGFPVLSVNGNFKRDLVDQTFIAAFIAGGTFALKLEYVSGIRVISPGVAKVYSKTWEMKFCQCLESPPQVSDAGAVADDINFEAHALDGVTSPISMVNINRLAANTL